NTVLGLAHVFALGGQSAKIDLIAPYTDLSGSAKFNGAPLERNVTGFADPKIRLSVNFIGAPVLDLKQFANYRQDLIVGGSLQIGLPLGQYADTRLINIGSNRWSLRPELGVSKTRERWTLELATGATFYTDNDDFYGGKRREQAPIYSTQGHLIYNFRNGWWVSLDATYFEGGSTTIDGLDKRDLQQNWRGGLTLAIPIDRQNSVKLYASNGVAARTGNEFDLFGLAWQHRWGGGL
ncbi:MAG TPA: transporter, partial [Spongiibacteraceae bacterium]|nr:transporter [Spongiibacteraceae bacterium]